jgi:hypothetical protein
MVTSKHMQSNNLHPLKEMAFSSIAKPVISLDSLDDGQQNYVAYILI